MLMLTEKNWSERWHSVTVPFMGWDSRRGQKCRDWEHVGTCQGLGLAKAMTLQGSRRELVGGVGVRTDLSWLWWWFYDVWNYTPPKWILLYLNLMYIYVADVENQGNWSSCNTDDPASFYFFYLFSSSTLPAPMPQCTWSTWNLRQPTMEIMILSEWSFWWSLWAASHF